MWSMILSSKPVRWLLAAGAAVLAVLAILARERRAGRKEAEQEAIRDAAERVEAGREAVRDGRERGGPDGRLRENDRQW